jgi:signal peptidase I
VSDERPGAETGAEAGAETGAETGAEAPGTDAVDAPDEGRTGVLGHAAAAVREVVLVLVMAMVLSFVVKTWFIQAFYIPSGSMENTLLIGDRVVVSKLTPGPIDLQRGDVIVFQDPGGWLDSVPLPEREGLGGAVHRLLVFVGLFPSESEDHLIKRVIGLPGDRVTCCGKDGRLSVNGQPVDETYIHPGDVPSTLEFDITVPAGRVWVMGDHRSDSEDSRFHDPKGSGAQGSVPIPDITGRAVGIVWPFDRFSWLTDHPEVFATVPDPVAAG